MRQNKGRTYEPRTVAVQVHKSHYHPNKWACVCAWCHCTIDNLETMADAIKWARDHVKECKHPSTYNLWEPGRGHMHDEWIIGFL